MRVPSHSCGQPGVARTQSSTCVPTSKTRSPACWSGRLPTSSPNAVQWSPPGQRVEISAQLTAPDLELRVRDHGPGIPSAARTQIFQPFQRLDDHGGGGVGLGLAIASGFIEAMGGELLIEDTPGGGSTFRILVSADVS